MNKRGRMTAVARRLVPGVCFLLVGGGLVAGCALTGSDAPTPANSAQVRSARGDAFASALTGPTQRTLAGGSAPTELHVQQLDVFQITVPVGAVSRSEEFWKRIDELAVEPATYDLLLKNGIRVGVAPIREWPYFRGIIDQYPAKSRQVAVTGGDAGAIELPLKEGVAFQNIFYFNDRNEAYGRTFERCDNLLGISFQPAPRRPGTVRLSVCPLVRSLRKRFEFRLNGDEREIEYVCPENLYDLNLITDVPIEGFLVVAPSMHARWPTSLGNTFLLSGGIAEEFEQVLLLVPRLTRVAEPLEPSPNK